MAPLYSYGGKILGSTAPYNCDHCPCQCDCASALVCSYCSSYTPTSFTVALSGVTDIPDDTYCCGQISSCYWEYDDGTIKVTVTMTGAGTAQINAYASSVLKYQSNVSIGACCPLYSATCPCTTWPPESWPCGGLVEIYHITGTIEIYDNITCSGSPVQTINMDLDLPYVPETSCRWSGDDPGYLYYPRLTGVTGAWNVEVSYLYLPYLSYGLANLSKFGVTPVGNYGDSDCYPDNIFGGSGKVLNVQITAV